jgi:hypothetical protein
MIETLSILRAPPLLSLRTANYVAALMRQGDDFDYSKWLRQVREEERQPNHIPTTFTPGEIIAADIGRPIGAPDCRGTWSNSGTALMTRTAPVPRVIYRSHYERSDRTPKARLRRRLEKVRDAWDDFQASRARDAVYGYLAAVFAIVEHLQNATKDQEAFVACVPNR